MLLKNIKEIVLVLIISGFASNTFAAWAVQKGHTRCVGNTCHHSTVKKGCVNGHCGAVRKSSTWHR